MTIIQSTTTNPYSTQGCLYPINMFYGPPGWCSGLRPPVAVPPETLGSSPGSVTAGRDREVHGATHNWPSVVRVWPVGIFLSHRALATPVAGWAQCNDYFILHYDKLSNVF